MDRLTDQPKATCPFIFPKVGGIKIHKSSNNSPVSGLIILANSLAPDKVWHQSGLI